MHVHTCMNKQGAVWISFSHCHHGKEKKFKGDTSPACISWFLCAISKEETFISLPF